MLPSERVEIMLPADLLEQYAGAYELRPGRDIVFTVVDNRLTGAMTGQPPDPLYAETKSRFFSKKFEAEFEFLRDAEGKVTHVVLRQNDAESKLPKKGANPAS